MNFNAVKQKFIDYLNANSDDKSIRGNFELRSQIIRKGSIENISIFSNMELFQEFLETEYDYKITNKSASISIEDIVKNMEIVDNQLAEIGETEEGQETSGEEIEETDEAEETDKTDKSGKSSNSKEPAQDEELNDTELIKGIINELLQDEEFISTYDTSGDNAIDKEELIAYLKQISAGDGNSDDISVQDLIANDTEEKSAYERMLDMASDEAGGDEAAISDFADNYSQGTSGSSGNFGGNYSGTPGGISGGAEPQKYNSDGSLNLDILDLPKLEKAKADETKNFEDKQSKLNELYSDGGDLAEAKGNVDKLLEAYNQKLEETDQDLAEKIEAKEAEISAKEAEISAKEAEISAKEAEISGIENNISSLNTSIETLRSAESQISEQMSGLEGENKTNANTKLANIRNEIASKEKEVKDLEAQLEKENKALEKLKGNEEGGLGKLKEDLEKLNGTEEGQLGYLQQQLREKHPDEAPELEQMYEKYKEEKNKYETDIKPKAIENAKQEVTNSQNELNRINAAIEQRKTEDVKQENTVYNTTLPNNVAAALDKKLGEGFADKLQEVCGRLNCSPEDLIGLMYSESGLNPSAVNKKSGATGLIQFMKSTANSLGTSTAELAGMSGVQQLTYVEKYIQNWKNNTGFSNDKQLTAGDLYTMVFLPAYSGREVLTVSGEKYYNANSGLDFDKDGKITKTDLTKQVQNKYNKFLGTI